MRFYVYGQELRMERTVVASGTIDYLTAQFTFQTADWDGAAKTAVFEGIGKTYSVLLTEDAILTTDHLNLAAGEWRVHLVGAKAISSTTQRLTTTQVRFMVDESGAVSGEALPEVPVSYGEQVLAAAKKAQDVAQSVRDDADAGKFKGDKGEKGETGATGPKGDTGAQGPKGETGPKGDAGVQGPKGDTGAKGDTGPTGPQGDTGAQGPKGETGAKGEKGDTGARGAQGEKGDAFTYADFTAAQLAALKGEKGDKGDKGDRGETGAGLTLSGSVAAYTDLPNNLTAADAGKAYFVEADGKLYIWSGTAWPANGKGTQFKGEKGDTGAQGPAGPKGEQGEKGDKGAQGEKGNAFTYADFTAAQLAALKGEKGDKGDKGEKGDKGAAFVYSDFTAEQLAGLKGPKGDTGAQGPKGDTGPAGDKGDTGAQGPQGEQGPKGDTGADGFSPTVSILPVAVAPGKPAKQSICITDAQGDHFCTVSDGADGAAGAKGDTGAPGSSVDAEVSDLTATEAHPNGGVQLNVTKTTYTASGQTSTSTFVTQIWNGKDGAKGADGKSAYQSAQDGGYSGTEAAFNAALAQVGNKADKPTALAVNLPASGWNATAKTQTVNAAGVTASALCIVVAAAESFVAYGEAQVRCSAQGAGTLTFTCEDVPTADLTANVLMVG